MSALPPYASLTRCNNTLQMVQHLLVPKQHTAAIQTSSLVRLKPGWIYLGEIFLQMLDLRMTTLVSHKRTSHTSILTQGWRSKVGIHPTLNLPTSLIMDYVKLGSLLITEQFT